MSQRRHQRPIPPSQSIQIGEIQQRLTVDNLPLPSPDVLKGYAETIPNAPERFMLLMEAQVRHRIEAEQKALDANIGTIQAGIQLQRIYAWMAFALAVILLLSFVAVSFITHNGYVSVGGLIFTIGGIITSFLVSGRQRMHAEQDSPPQG